MKVFAAAASLLTSTVQGETLVVSLKHDPLKIAALAELVDDIADPKSSNYGKWLKSKEIEKYTSASNEQISDVKEWLNKEKKNCQEERNVKLDFHLTGQNDFLEVNGFNKKCIKHFTNKKVWSNNEFNEGIFIKKKYSKNSKTTTTNPEETKKKNTLKSESHAMKFVKLNKDGIADVGSPPEQKIAYDIPSDISGAAENNLQMVWGPGTFGYLQSDLEEFYSDFDVANADINTVSVNNIVTFFFSVILIYNIYISVSFFLKNI